MNFELLNSVVDGREGVWRPERVNRIEVHVLLGFLELRWLFSIVVGCVVGGIHRTRAKRRIVAAIRLVVKGMNRSLQSFPRARGWSFGLRFFLFRFTRLVLWLFLLLGAIKLSFGRLEALFFFVFLSQLVILGFLLLNVVDKEPYDANES